MIPVASTLEKNPLRAVSIILSLFQFMFITLDLFMDTSLSPQWHVTITTIELVVALLLCVFNTLRLHRLMEVLKPKLPNKAVWWLLLTILLQLAIAGVASYSFTRNADWAEWSMFSLSIAFGLLHPATFGVAEDAIRKESAEHDLNEKEPLGLGGAIISVFTQHFTRKPVLLVLSTLFAILQSVLHTYQGAVINSITQAVTKTDSNGLLVASLETVRGLSCTLVGVWAATCFSDFCFDFLSSQMYAILEVWMRDEIFCRATNVSVDIDGTCSTSEKLTAADYHARYASDVTNVVGLYETLLKRVVVDILLIATAFIFLAITEWKVATCTLGFLVMAVYSGPTDTAREASDQVQNEVTTGINILSEVAQKGDSIDLSGDDAMEGKIKRLISRHREEALMPLRKDAFRRFFFSETVESFIKWMSSFLTVIVVISMSWSVFHGEMDSSDFLGTFFVFKQLQKPATKLSGILKELSSKSANLDRINALIFRSPDQQNG